MTLSLLLGLVIGNLCWSAHPTLAKLVLQDFTPLETAWLRYFTAFLAWATAVPFLRRRGPVLPGRVGLRTWGAIALAGLLCFCVGPWMQVEGLARSQAVDNALIVATEPLITVLLAVFFLSERPRSTDLAAFALALAGFWVLSGGLTPGLAFSGANVLLILSLFGESSFSILGRAYARRVAPFALFGGTLVLGMFGLSLVALWKGVVPVPHFFERLSWSSGLALLWLGPLGTTLSYIYWMTALARAPVASVALTLLVQPVFGAMWGVVFLHEELTPAKLSGGALILAALLLATLWRPGGKLPHANELPPSG